jgi:exopolyphosphatase/guanosine-5'-triphosphate,3'-diphosphate pyrophosphatase
MDIGSNTVRLLVAECSPEGGEMLVPLLHERSITRLAGGIEASGRLDPDGARMTVDILEKYVRTAADYGVSIEDILAAGTSALREASDSEAFLVEVKTRAGLDIKVLTPEEEARISARGVFAFVPDARSGFVLDIGGGSTEAMKVEGSQVVRHASLPTGVVKLTERHLANSGVPGEELNSLNEDCLSAAKELAGFFGSLDVQGAEFIATAGTATTLAAIDMSLEKYDRDLVNGYKIKISAIRDIFQRLSGLSIEERRDVPGLEKGREDLIIAGVALTIGVMEVFGFNEMTVSDSGLLEGLCIIACESE